MSSITTCRSIRGRGARLPARKKSGQGIAPGAWGGEREAGDEGCQQNHGEHDDPGVRAPVFKAGAMPEDQKDQEDSESHSCDCVGDGGGVRGWRLGIGVRLWIHGGLPGKELVWVGLYEHSAKDGVIRTGRAVAGRDASGERARLRDAGGRGIVGGRVVSMGAGRGA